jgi:4-carboxymuconolactone decarboxylase
LFCSAHPLQASASARAPALERGRSALDCSTPRRVRRPYNPAGVSTDPCQQEEMNMKQLGAVLVVTLALAGQVTAQDRMPPIPPEKMTAAQKKAVTDYKAIRKVDLAGPPWTVLLRVPDLVVPSLQLRMHNVENSALSPKLTELAILMAARHWTNSFEWNAHHGLAVKAGLSPAVIAAIGDGRRPEQMADDEAILYDFCTELLNNRSVSDATYARALAKFGEPGVVEAAGLEGYYTFLAMVMNVARSPSPANATEKLAPFPK